MWDPIRYTNMMKSVKNIFFFSSGARNRFGIGFAMIRPVFSRGSAPR